MGGRRRGEERRSSAEEAAQSDPPPLLCVGGKRIGRPQRGSGRHSRGECPFECLSRSFVSVAKTGG
jgi:hypothetical protein